MKRILLVVLVLVVGQISFAQTNGATVEAGKWYRIAQNSGNRANARLILWDYISSGGHSTLEFKLGTSFNFRNGISFSLINHNYYYQLTFTKVRVLTRNTYDPQYLEVYVRRSGSVNCSIENNVQSSGWDAVAWSEGFIPSGYIASEYDVNYLFAIGDNKNQFTISRGGNVNIGDVSSDAMLHIKGDNSASSKSILRLSGDGDANLRFGVNTNYSWIQSHGSLPLCINELGNNTILNRLNGNVGIGTTSPDYKLDVLGTIRAQELKVDMQGADFVFEKDYQLRPIEEVETFVQENKHLPEIAPAKEMQENGVNQSEMNQKLLQKIEELTLYVIDLNKKVGELQEENKELRNKINQ